MLHLVAPKPRAVLASEKTYLTSTPDGKTSNPRQLPCWHDRWLAERRLREADKAEGIRRPGLPDAGAIEPAEIEMSVVIPTYNEELRILPALEEMVQYLDARFGRPAPNGTKPGPVSPANPTTTKRHPARKGARPEPAVAGYEILVVNDGSKDRTAEVVLDFARRYALHDVLRLVTLERNRGKGGGVTHGFRHVRGRYVMFADADGASRFSDLGKLVEGCEDVVDGSNRGVAIGSRSHLVGSEAVVKVRTETINPDPFHDAFVVWAAEVLNIILAL